MSKMAELLASLLESKAEEEQRLMKLWEEVGPEQYGADSEDVAKLRGRSEGLTNAAGLVRHYLVEEEDNG